MLGRSWLLNICHMYVITRYSNWMFSLKIPIPLFRLLTLTPLQLVHVCINSSYRKCQLWSVFVKYTSRALYLTNCELMAVECEIPFLKLLFFFFCELSFMERTTTPHTTAPTCIISCFSDVLPISSFVLNKKLNTCTVRLCNTYMASLMAACTLAVKL